MSIKKSGTVPTMLNQPEQGPQAVALSGVTKQYWSEAGAVQVLRGIDLRVAPGETVVLKGVSGSGKSTLLHILGAIETPTTGTVHIVGTNLTTLDARGQTAFRASSVGFVFQFFNLIPTLTATENVVAALEPLGGTRHGRAQAAAQALAAVGLAEHAGKYPSQLSGGQQQRIAIARAVAKRPALLLADEPTGALDSATAHQVLDCLKAMQRETGCAMIIATHDALVCQYADRVYRVENGRLVLDNGTSDGVNR